MYKKRFFKWRLRKNLRAEEKENFLTTAQSELQQLFRGVSNEKIKQRADRHRRTQAIRRHKLTLQDDAAEDDDDFPEEKMEHLEISTANAMMQMSQTLNLATKSMFHLPGLKNFEHLDYQLYHYFKNLAICPSGSEGNEVYFDNGGYAQARRNFRQRPLAASHKIFAEWLGSALDWNRNGQVVHWELLHRALDISQPVIKSESPHLLCALAMQLGEIHHDERLVRNICSFLAEMSGKIHGRSHPLSVVLTTVSTSPDMRSMLLWILSITASLTTNRRVISESLSIECKAGYLCRLADTDPEQALEDARMLCCLYQEPGMRESPNAKHVHATLARVLIKAGRLDEAERLLLDTHAATGAAILRGYLMAVYKLRGNIEKWLYWRKESVRRLEMEGFPPLRRDEGLLDLVRVLQDNKMQKEIEDLERQYPHLPNLLNPSSCMSQLEDPGRASTFYYDMQHSRDNACFRTDTCMTIVTRNHMRMI